MKRIHQFVENLVPGDAISNDCVQIYSYLNKLGYDSHIYTHASLIKRPFIHHYTDTISPEDGIIFHHSTNSPLLDFVGQLPNKKMLIYHNITPSAFFREYNYSLFKIFKEAERQNYLLENSSFDAIVGDSKYNLSLIKEFIKASHEEVIPPFLALQFKSNAQAKPENTDKENFTMIFVGRFAPNKKQNDIIKVFEYYSKFINPKARLILIGHYSYAEPYFNEILTYIKDRDIKNITIQGALTSDDLAKVYNESDVFLSMSEHEGFCIPVLESIHFNVPVFAYKIPALEELLDKKYLFDHKDYKKIGEALFQFQINKKLRKKIIIDQKKVLKKFQEAKIKSKFKSLIHTVFNT
jgi:glycosyltransferase involved in cell wall biosynthesis